MARVKFQMLLLLASFFWTFNETHSTVTNSTALYFGLMLSLSDDDQSSGALAGVQAALDEINSRDDLLPGYSLNFTPIIDSNVNDLKSHSCSFNLELLVPRLRLLHFNVHSVTEELHWMDYFLSCFNLYIRRLH